jgi:hypothetical protein
MGISFYHDAAVGAAFKQHTLSAWVRVPVKHFNDQNQQGLARFFPTLKRELASRGTLGFIGALLTTLRETSNDTVTRRIDSDEQQAIDEAEKTFRLIEHQSPMRLKPFTRHELWKAIYLGHRQNSNSAPTLPDIPGCDIRDYLCGETIAGDGHFVMHGSYPAAVVSMFVPPQPNIFADCMRVLTTNPELNFRHNVRTKCVKNLTNASGKLVAQTEAPAAMVLSKAARQWANSPPFAKKSLATPRLSLRHASTPSFTARPQPTKNSYILHCAILIATVSNSSLPFAAFPAPKQTVKNR